MTGELNAPDSSVSHYLVSHEKYTPNDHLLLLLLLTNY